MSKTEKHRNGSFLERNENRFEYWGRDTSAYMEFDYIGARDIIDFFNRTQKINGEEIRCFNFSSNIVKDIMDSMYCYDDINIVMMELREKYNISSNYVFFEDIRNLIFLLKEYLYTGSKKEIAKVVSKIKRITRGKVNEG